LEHCARICQRQELLGVAGFDDGQSRIPPPPDKITGVIVTSFPAVRNWKNELILPMFRNRSNAKKYFLQWLLVRQYKVSGRFIVPLDVSHADMEAAR